MKTLIIEDEHLPAQRLEKLLGELLPEAKVMAVLQSIDESVEWFASNPMPELVFMDIHLADGSSFTIFDDVRITCPIIFTTAYDQYALKAFEVNSVDYLLKPISKTDLKRALDKLRAFAASGVSNEDRSDMIDRLASALSKNYMAYKRSLLVSVRDTLVPLPVKEIAYFIVDNKMVTAVRFDGKQSNIEMTMDELSRQLDPNDFFRANRQYLISRKAVRDIAQWFGNRVAVNLVMPTPDRIVVSRTNVREFKNWVTA